jgi:hypothetical protein
MRSTRQNTFRYVRLSPGNPARVSALAACLLIGATSLQAHTFCVNSELSLRNALAAASDNGANDNEDNVINIVAKTYSTTVDGDEEFGYFNQTTTRKLDINGGYTAGCATQIKNPELTILDGGGISRVFESDSASGDVSVRHLTIQNGMLTGTFPGSGAGIEMNQSTGLGGEIIVEFNIFRNNSAGNGVAGGLYAASGGANPIYIENNLFVGNSDSGNSGAANIFNNGSGNVYITSNTFTQNTTTSTSAEAVGGLGYYGAPVPGNISNNIFWGNTGLDISLSGENSGSILLNNAYATIRSTEDTSVGVGSGGNVNVDPQFVSSSDFHLGASSPLLGQGDVSPPGNLPTLDLDGNPRVYSSIINTVDMGAYERGDEIFTDGLGGGDAAAIDGLLFPARFLRVLACKR